ncbi:hypothetical protein ScPMuIL_018759 [Solemya velum]
MSVESVFCLLLCVCGGGGILYHGADPSGGEGASELSAFPRLCGAPNYDVRNLTASVWTFRWHACINMGVNCTFKMAFCQPLPEFGNCENASVCMTGTNVISMKLGEYQDNPFIPSSSPGPSILFIGFLAQFVNGDAYNTTTAHACELSVFMEFHCDLNLHWPAAREGVESVVPPGALTDVSFDDTKCEYTFKFRFSGACLTVTPSSPVAESLSAGTILIIIFVTTLAIYFMLGISLNAARGHRGTELIPQSELWTQLPATVVEGVAYTCRCCTAKKEAYDSI